MDPPLVTSDDNAGTPLLSAGPQVIGDDEDHEHESSQMMALLMKRPEIEPTDFLLVEEEKPLAPEFSLLTVAAGTLTLLQCGLVWGSYLSDSWSDTHLLTSIDWQRKYLPFLNDYTDAVIQQIDLGSILSILRASKEYVLLAVVAVTAVGIPCISIISNPMRVTKQYYKTYGGASCRDLALRFSFFVIHLLLLLDLATSITIEWTDTAFRIQNCMRKSMFSYIVGMTAAVGVVSVLRFGSMRAREISSQQEQRQYSRIPPASAFRHSWPVAESYTDEVNDVINGVSDPLESRQRQESSWYSCFTWQLGLATIVLWLPCFSLPLLRISYHGLAAEFMSDTQVDVYLWQLPQLLWHPCNDNKWMVMITEVLVVLQTLILPLAVVLVGMAVLKRKTLLLRKWLVCLHPMVNSVTFAAAVLLVAPSLESMTTYLLNEDSSGFCEKFNGTTGEPCLTTSGTSLPGAWFFLIHSVMLELFCILVTGAKD